MNIGEHPFEWSKSEGRYGYLSKDDSELFDITECETIKRLFDRGAVVYVPVK